MGNMNVTLPEVLAKEVEAVTKPGGMYKNKAEFIRDAVKTLFSARKDLRIKAAVEMYKKGEISIGKVAELVDVNYDEAEELLIEEGIEIKRGAASVKELNKGAEKLLETVKQNAK
jgi:predicted HTH domain antitoxin